MSRIGNRILTIPNGVSVTINPSTVVTKGPLGTLETILPHPNPLQIHQQDNTIVIRPNNELKQTKMLHGTINALLNNALIGVSQGFSKQLQLVGVGYRASMKDDSLVLSLGYSHPIVLKIPKGIKVSVEKNTLISISGSDKQQIGEFAIQIRNWRKPEPYKGKGVLYVNEQIIRKAGKTSEGKK